MQPDTIHVFIGFDQRQTVGYTVAAQSLMMSSTKPLAIHPLILETLKPYGFERRGLTPFTFSRFLVPWLMGFEGWAVFMDSDIMATRDIAALVEWCREDQNRRAAEPAPGGDYIVPAVYVRDVEGFEFERAALMVFDCGHSALRCLTPKNVGSEVDLPAPHCITTPLDDDERLDWGIVDPAHMAAFPPEWGVLVGYEEIPEGIAAVHFTQGLPCHEETVMMPLANDWNAIFRVAVSTMPWSDLMGQSVHAYEMPDGKRLPLAHPLAIAAQLAKQQEAAGPMIMEVVKPGDGSDPVAETRALYGDDFDASPHPHITDPAPLARDEDEDGHTGGPRL